MTVAINAAYSATSGVAPHYLHCDASGTTSDQTSRPFHDVRYQWSVTSAPVGVDLGELYATGVPMPKWTAYGPIAGFCFEVPGTYTIKLSVWDGTQFAVASQNITVSDPDSTYSGTNTICFSTDGNFSGAPAGCQQITTASWNTATASLAQNKRLLFRRGQSFNCTAEWAAGAINGPWQIGAFGSGSEKARITATGAVSFAGSGILQIGAYNSTNLLDAKVFDLEFDPGANSCTPIWYRGQFDDILLLRVFGVNAGSLITYVGQNRGTTDHCTRRLGMFECRNVMPKGGASIQYFAAPYADYMTIRGCYGDQTGGGTHSLRVFNAYKSCISNNTFIGGDNARHCIKMHSTEWVGGVPYASSDGTSDGGGYAKLNVFSFNLFRATPQCRWPGAFGPPASITESRVDDNLIECNFVPSEASNTVQAAFYVSGSLNTVRNNVADLSQAGTDTKALLMFTKRMATMPTPTGNAAYNNTVYYSGNQVGFRLAQVDAGVENTSIRNNLAYAPAASSPSIVVDAGTGTTTGNNTTNVATNPNFSGPASSLTGYALSPGSPYIGTGAKLRGFYDAYGNSRGVNADAHDAGALVRLSAQHRQTPI